MSAKDGKFPTHLVRCPDFTKTFGSIEQAQRWVEQVTAAGHCGHEHVIEPWVESGQAEPIR